MSFELELSKAIPKVQKELNRPGEGRMLRISKDPHEATWLEQRRSGRNDTRGRYWLLPVRKALDFGRAWRPVISAAWQF